MKTFSRKRLMARSYREAFLDALPAGFPAFVVLIYCTVLTSYDNLKHLWEQKNSPDGGTADYTAFFGSEELLVFAALIVCGMLAAYRTFSFLLSRKKLNVFMSMPYTRRELYFCRVSGTLTLLFAVVAIPLVITLAMNTMYLGMNPDIIRCFLRLLFSRIVSALMGFTVFTFAILLCGTRTEALFGTAAILTIPAVLTYYIDYSLAVFLRGHNSKLSSYSIDSSFLGPELSRKLYFLNPLKATYLSTSGYELSDGFLYVRTVPIEGDSRIFTPAVLLVFTAWLILCCLVILASRKLFIKRTAERAGIPGTNKRLTLFIAGTLTFALASVALTRTASLNFAITKAPDMHRALSLLLFLTIAFILSFAVYTAAIYKKNVRKTLKAAFITVCAFSILPAILLTGGLGFTKRIPDKEDIVSICCSVPKASVDAANDLTFVQLQPDATGLVFTDSESIDRITEIHAAAAAEKGEFPFPLGIYYQLTDGTVVKRIFRTASSDTVNALIELTKGDAYKRYLSRMLLDDPAYNLTLEPFIKDSTVTYSIWDYSRSVKNEDKTNTVPNLYLKIATPGGSEVTYENENLSFEGATELKEALLKDLTENNIIPFAENRDALAVITLRSGPYGSGNVFYLYPKMKETLKCLGDLGLLSYIKDDSEELLVSADISDINGPALYAGFRNITREGYLEDPAENHNPLLTESRGYYYTQTRLSKGIPSEAYKKAIHTTITDPEKLKKLTGLFVDTCFTGTDNKYSYVRLTYSDGYVRAACVPTAELKQIG